MKDSEMTSLTPPISVTLLRSLPPSRAAAAAVLNSGLVASPPAWLQYCALRHGFIFLQQWLIVNGVSILSRFAYCYCQIRYRAGYLSRSASLFGRIVALDWCESHDTNLSDYLVRPDIGLNVDSRPVDLHNKL